MFAAVSIAIAGGYVWSVRASRDESSEAPPRENAEQTNAIRNAGSPTTHGHSSPIPVAMLGMPVVFLLMFWAADAKVLSSRAVIAGLFLAALAGAGGFSLQRKLEPETSGKMEDRESDLEHSSMEPG